MAIGSGGLEGTRAAAVAVADAATRLPAQATADAKVNGGSIQSNCPSVFRNKVWQFGIEGTWWGWCRRQEASVKDGDC